jgi:membrane-bound ClpP family serine protease
MSLPTIAMLLALAGLIFLVAELLLPTHGLLGVLGVGALLGAVAVCFFIDPWLGTGLFAASVIAAPFVGALAMRMWPRTPLGRRLLLVPPQPTPVEPPPVQPGTMGVAISELRPIGVVEFGELRLEAESDRGIIDAGAKVRVANVVNRRPIVRAV